MTLNDKKLEKLIEKCLEEFYTSRLDKLETLNLQKIIMRKNPYLLRATNNQKVSEIIDNIVYGFVQASDETIFGEKFFEALAREFSIGKVSSAEGVDLEIETKNTFSAYSIKSTAHAHNSSAQKKQMDQFNTMKKRLTKLHKEFDPVLGASYGKINSLPTPKRHYRIIAGQKFWEEITNDSEFYLKIIMLMKTIPQKHARKYKPKLDKFINTLNREFIVEFCSQDGSVDWKKLAQFVSKNPK